MSDSIVEEQHQQRAPEESRVRNFLRRVGEKHQRFMSVVDAALIAAKARKQGDDGQRDQRKVVTFRSFVERFIWSTKENSSSYTTEVTTADPVIVVAAEQNATTSDFDEASVATKSNNIGLTKTAIIITLLIISISIPSMAVVVDTDHDRAYPRESRDRNVLPRQRRSAVPRDFYHLFSLITRDMVNHAPFREHVSREQANGLQFDDSRRDECATDVGAVDFDFDDVQDDGARNGRLRDLVSANGARIFAMYTTIATMRRHLNWLRYACGDDFRVCGYTSERQPATHGEPNGCLELAEHNALCPTSFYTNGGSGGSGGDSMHEGSVRHSLSQIHLLLNISEAFLQITLPVSNYYLKNMYAYQSELDQASEQHFTTSPTFNTLAETYGIIAKLAKASPKKLSPTLLVVSEAVIPIGHVISSAENVTRALRHFLNCHVVSFVHRFEAVARLLSRRRRRAAVPVDFDADRQLLRESRSRNDVGRSSGGAFVVTNDGNVDELFGDISAARGAIVGRRDTRLKTLKELHAERLRARSNAANDVIV